MDLKQSLLRALRHARSVSEAMLTSFTTPQEWTHQVCPGANHALWFAGHMGVIDNLFIAVVDRGKYRKMPGYEEVFSMGTQPTGRAEDYPPVDEVLDFMRDRRIVLTDLLKALALEDLSKPTPEGTPPFLPDIASVFEAAVWHEGLHSGQVSVARKALGYPPLH